MEQFAEFDFHLHSEWSYDAVATVEDYFKLARERKLKAIALTEHHNLDSFAEVQSVAKDYPDIAYMACAELTVYSQFGSTDMVCMNLPPEPTGELKEVLMAYRQWQQDYGRALVEAIDKAGWPFSREEHEALLRRYRPEKAMKVQGITHVQNDLQVNYVTREKGFFADKQAYYEFLWTLDLPKYPAASWVIPAVKKAGGIVFIAHPTGYFKRDDLHRMDEMREVLGFDGIECAHDSVPEELTPFYRDYCLKHKLLSTAGSDCHSLPQQLYRFCEHHTIGHHRGDYRWAEEIMERVTVYNR